MIGCLLLALMGPFLDDLKTIKELPQPCYLWATPANPVPDEVIELGRVVGSVGVMAEDGSAKITQAVQWAAAAKAKRTATSKPVVLSVAFRPWRTISDPRADSMWQELGLTYGQGKAIAGAIAGSTYKPPVVCLVDAESFDCTAELNRARCEELYGLYDAFIRLAAGCVEVHWYGFGAIPAPALPDEWGFHAFAAPFDGMPSLSYEAYYLNEANQRREASRRARSYAVALSATKTVAWVAAPGSGRAYRWTNSMYSEWVWDAGPEVYYDTQLGRELFVAWYRNRPLRYMDPADAVVIYPSPLDPRIVDPDRKHLIAFLRGATE